MISFKLSGVVAGATALLILGLSTGASAQEQRVLTIEELRARFPEAPPETVTPSTPGESADVVAEPASDSDCSEEDGLNADGTCAITLGTQRGRRIDMDLGGNLSKHATGSGGKTTKVKDTKVKDKTPQQVARSKPAGPSAAQLEAARRGDLYILFRTGSADLTAVDRANLNVFATFMAERPDARFVIEGHTDAVGDAEYNMGLSKRRAMAVHDYLIAQGVSSTRLQAEGYGFNRLRDPARPTSGANRRVEASEVKID